MHDSGTLATPMAISKEGRRIVTVLFADMAGSTALGEGLDPEEMRRLLARYYAIARESCRAARRHGREPVPHGPDSCVFKLGSPPLRASYR
jgi:class 3 adenylate cyclase